MITNFNNETKLDYKDVLIVPQPSEVESRNDVNLFKDGSIPIIVANMDSIGNFRMAQAIKEYRLMVAIIKDFSPAEWQTEITERNLDESLLIPSVGTQNLDFELKKIDVLLSIYPNIKMVCLDVANGYIKSNVEAIRSFKKVINGRTKLAAGNVVTPEGVKMLAEAGADIVKLGIGSGGVCLTRDVTGVGYPQLSAIMDCQFTARSLGVELIADGGIIKYGDFGKAFAAGADYVMAGSIFAGHREVSESNFFYGMSSDRAQKNRNSNKPYRASEGREVFIESNKCIEDTMRGILGGLRSTCTYVGAHNLTDMKNQSIQMVRVSRQINNIQDHE